MKIYLWPQILCFFCVATVHFMPEWVVNYFGVYVMTVTLAGIYNSCCVLYGLKKDYTKMDGILAYAFMHYLFLLFPTDQHEDLRWTAIKWSSLYLLYNWGMLYLFLTLAPG